MPEELASDPRYEPPVLILTALAYLNGTSRQLCPTRVVPGSFRSGRRPPRDGEDYDLSESTATSWGDKRAHVALAQPGDILLFRSASSWVICLLRWFSWGRVCSKTGQKPRLP